MKTVKTWGLGLLSFVAALALSACEEKQTDTRGSAASQPSSGAASGSPAQRARAARADFSTVMRGGRLYAQNCSQCHGQLAQGAPQWQKPGPDGKYPAPPLNGTGHAWHHPLAALKATIRDGTLRMGGSMPPWRDKLSEEDIQAIIAWFQSHWPEEIYTAWKRIDDGARARK